MDLKDLTIGIVFLLQSTVGILGNFSLLSCYLIRYYTEHTLKNTDLILTHLFIANSLIVASKGTLETTGALEMKGFFNDFGCKLLLYVQRLGRSMSIGTTCLVSVFQAITISRSDSCWNGLKVKVLKRIGLFTSFCWILYMSVNMIFPVYTYTKGNSKNLTPKSDMKYCSTVGHDDFTGLLYTAFFVFPEVLLSLLIIWSSGSMVVILYRHKQQVQHIRSTHVSSRTSPESRATQSILVLVFTFLGFYALSSILQGCIALMYNPDWMLVNITAIISMCFPTVGPFVMSHDTTVPKLCYSRVRNPKIP
ncbi:vomeronasal type-1 receptor 4-like [Peromyscus californicus insignis]|uniref:vomeronasal type-1 receptor 4-like n=1 Tax=Peromyscus californicus insignis TaxID=564181 RepID=UPI0022A70C8E|nr:vomeronasal type-1 receptor 4-like [Peromyscus californicus insignis]